MGGSEDESYRIYKNCQNIDNSETIIVNDLHQKNEGENVN